MIVLDKYLPNIVKEIPFAVFRYEDGGKFKGEEMLRPIKMDIGSEGKISIQLELEKSCYHLKDCMKGFVHFTQVSITLKSM